MFFKLFELKKLPIISNGSRSVNRFYNKWALQQKHHALSLFKKWKAGRNKAGKIIFWTRKSLLNKTATFKINYNFRYNKIGFIASFKFIPFKNRLLTLVYFANGAATYYITSQFHKIFSYTYLNFSKKIKKMSLKSTFLMLFQIKKLTLVSLLELTPGKGAQYSRSNGTSCKLLKFNVENHTVLVQLPSTIKKLFSYYSFSALGYVALSQHKKFHNTKAGYWRSFGIKSIVRGVAMNPVDHPHGGRTKAIKYPRTPWGATTKYK